MPFLVPIVLGAVGAALPVAIAGAPIPAVLTSALVGAAIGALSVVASLVFQEKSAPTPIATSRIGDVQVSTFTRTGPVPILYGYRPVGVNVLVMGNARYEEVVVGSDQRREQHLFADLVLGCGEGPCKDALAMRMEDTPVDPSKWVFIPGGDDDAPIPELIDIVDPDPVPRMLHTAKVFFSGDLGNVQSIPNISVDVRGIYPDQQVESEYASTMLPQRAWMDGRGGGDQAGAIYALANYSASPAPGPRGITVYTMPKADDRAVAETHTPPPSAVASDIINGWYCGLLNTVVMQDPADLSLFWLAPPGTTRASSDWLPLRMGAGYQRPIRHAFFDDRTARLHTLHKSASGTWYIQVYSFIDLRGRQHVMPAFDGDDVLAWTYKPEDGAYYLLIDAAEPTISAFRPGSDAAPREWRDIALATSDPPTVNFPQGSFGQPTPLSNLHTVGVADQSSNAAYVRLATGTRAAGAVWFGTKQPVASSWESLFTFRIRNVEGGGADGLAFVIQNSAAGTAAIGSPGGAMGYGDNTEGPGIANSVAIELDTWDNIEYPDPDSNHVSVQARGSLANSPSHDYSLGSAALAGNLSDGAEHTVRIVYDAAATSLRIYVDDLVTPKLTVTVNLSTTLSLDEGRAFVGFTAGTGALPDYQDHDLTSWTFTPVTTAEEVVGLVKLGVLLYAFYPTSVHEINVADGSVRRVLPITDFMDEAEVERLGPDVRCVAVSQCSSRYMGVATFQGADNAWGVSAFYSPREEGETFSVPQVYRRFCFFNAENVPNRIVRPGEEEDDLPPATQLTWITTGPPEQIDHQLQFAAGADYVSSDPTGADATPLQSDGYLPATQLTVFHYVIPKYDNFRRVIFVDFTQPDHNEPRNYQWWWLQPPEQAFQEDSWLLTGPTSIPIEVRRGGRLYEVDQYVGGYRLPEAIDDTLLIDDPSEFGARAAFLLGDVDYTVDRGPWSAEDTYNVGDLVHHPHPGTGDDRKFICDIPHGPPFEVVEPGTEVTPQVWRLWTVAVNGNALVDDIVQLPGTYTATFSPTHNFLSWYPVQQFMYTDAQGVDAADAVRSRLQESDRPHFEVFSQIAHDEHDRFNLWGYNEDEELVLIAEQAYMAAWETTRQVNVTEPKATTVAFTLSPDRLTHRWFGGVVTPASESVDLLMNARYGAGAAVEGTGRRTQPQIVLHQWLSLHGYSMERIQIDGEIIRRFIWNHLIAEDSPIADVLEEILAPAQAYLLHLEGGYGVAFENGSVDPVMTLDASTIQRDSVQIGVKSARTLVNRVTARFFNIEDRREDDRTANDDYDQRVTGEVRTKELVIDCVTDPRRVLYLAILALESPMSDRLVYAFNAGLVARLLEPGDPIAFRNPDGLSPEQVIRLVSVEDVDHGVKLEAQQITPYTAGRVSMSSLNVRVARRTAGVQSFPGAEARTRSVESFHGEALMPFRPLAVVTTDGYLTLLAGLPPGTVTSSIQASVTPSLGPTLDVLPTSQPTSMALTAAVDGLTFSGPAAGVMTAFADVPAPATGFLVQRFTGGPTLRTMETVTVTVVPRADGDTVEFVRESSLAVEPVSVETAVVWRCEASGVGAGLEPRLEDGSEVPAAAWKDRGEWTAVEGEADAFESDGEYLVIGFRCTNGVFPNSIAVTLDTGAASSIVPVFEYSCAPAEETPLKFWRPLAVLDRTGGFRQSGRIHLEIPPDWSAHASWDRHGNLIGGDPDTAERMFYIRIQRRSATSGGCTVASVALENLPLLIVAPGAPARAALPVETVGQSVVVRFASRSALRERVLDLRPGNTVVSTGGRPSIPRVRYVEMTAPTSAEIGDGDIISAEPGDVTVRFHFASARYGWGDVALGVGIYAEGEDPEVAGASVDILDAGGTLLRSYFADAGERDATAWGAESFLGEFTYEAADRVADGTDDATVQIRQLGPGGVLGEVFTFTLRTDG